MIPSLPLIQKPVDELSGYRYPGGNVGQVVGAEPGGVPDFGFIGVDFATGAVGHEAHHQRIGKGPRLAGEVSDIFYGYSDFFSDFPGDAFFKIFSGLHESCQNAVISGFKTSIVGQKNFIFFYNRYDNGRRHPWVVKQPAARTNLGPFVLPVLGGPAAFAAELMVAIPVDQLVRLAGDPDQFFFYLTEKKLPQAF